MSHSNPNAGVHRVFLALLALLALGFSATSVLAQSTADIYFIHPDHLNTPRVITNNVNQVVWRWDNLDPFGANAPNENPSSLGNFTCNLRLPGQYFDRETKLHYNYFRDYDPSIGRYIQSDPIGLRGGLNTYAYVDNNPLSFSDPEGLQFRRPFPNPLFPTLPAKPAPDPPQLLFPPIESRQSHSSSSGDRPGPETQALPKSGKCLPEDWEFCYRKCGGRPNTDGCYVSWRWKTRMFNAQTGGSIREPERVVNCNCACP
jgi:RHS repeat-associated protein